MGDFSGGVAIFVRSWLGCLEVPGGQVVCGRALVCAFEIPGCPPFLAASAYLHHSEGLSDANLSLLSSLGVVPSTAARPWILGAGFHMDPEVFRGS
eukprot:8091851-Pyramimonas_sp.AAC.1